MTATEANPINAINYCLEELGCDNSGHFDFLSDWRRGKIWSEYKTYCANL